ncbi:MAG: hypothetical protein IJP48_07335 [Synergistaceae bacterium]|nr:hypothetical protein [Synergistaceae bacterium]
MKNNTVRLILLTAMIYALACGGSIYAAQINNKNLDDVSDVAAESNIDLKLQKDSLLVIRSDGLTQYFYPEVITFKQDGTIASDFQGTTKFSTINVLDYQSIYQPAVSAKILSDDRSKHLIFSPEGFLFNTNLNDDGEVEFSNNSQHVTKQAGQVVSATQAKAGLFTANNDIEIFVELSNRYKDDGTGYDGNAPAYLRFYEIKEDASGFKTSALEPALEFKAANSTVLNSCNIVVGDFDYDGVPDEVMLIGAQYHDNSYNRYPLADMYKITRDSNGKLTRTKKFSIQDKNTFDTSSNNNFNIDSFLNENSVDSFYSKIAAGDFDSDGNKEVAAITYRNEMSAVFKWNTSTNKMNLVISDSSVSYTDATIAADLNGDGRDEIVYISYGNVSIAGLKEDSNSPELLFKKDNIFTIEDTYSFAAGSFRGVMGTNKFVQEIAVTVGLSQNRLYLLIPTLSDTGEITDITCKEVKAFDSKSARIGIAASDFTSESLRLGTPLHMKADNVLDYVVILQAPPYHVDYIPVPWEGGEAKVKNISYSDGLGAKYVNNSGSGNETEVAYKMSSAIEKVREYSLEMGLDKDLDFLEKWFGFSVSNNNKLSEKTEKIEENSNKNADSVKIQTTNQTDTPDSLVLYRSAMHVWRYPVLNPVPKWITGEPLKAGTEDPGDDTKETYISFVMHDAPKLAFGTSKSESNYHPIHEEGNLFSYPTSLATLPGYTSRKRTLAPATSRARSSNNSMLLTFEQSKSDSSSSETTATREETDTVSVSANILMAFLTGSGSTSTTTTTSTGNSQSFTKSFSNEESIEVTIPGSTEALNYADYNFDGAAYIDAAGTTMLGFAVTDFGRDSAKTAPLLWRNSVYTQKTDPSFVLPNKFIKQDDGEWIANADKETAMELRGVRFFDVSADQYVPSTLLTGGHKYLITIPVYNASFVKAETSSAKKVKANLYYQRRSASLSDESNRTFIGDTEITLDGWKPYTSGQSDSNKGSLTFTWTVDKSLEGHNYYLIAELDPDNEFDEVHEGWSESIPGGNNDGLYGFAVWDGSSGVSSSAVTATDKGNDTLKDVGIYIYRPTFSIDGKSLKNFGDNPTKPHDPFAAEFSIMYDDDEADDILPEVRLELWRMKRVSTDEGEDLLTDLIAGKNIPALFKNREYKFSVIIDPDLLPQGDENSYLLLTATPAKTSSTGLGTYLIENTANDSYDDDGDDPDEDPETEQGAQTIGGGSSGGCELGLGSVILMAGLALAIMNRK